MTNLTGTRVSSITNKPQDIVGRGAFNDVVHCIQGTIAVAAGNLTTSDVVYVTPVPWNAKIHEIILFNDDLDSNATPTLAAHVGLHKMLRDGTFSALDNAVYATAITTFQAANTAGVNVAFEARDINKIGQTVVTDAGLTGIPSDGGIAILSITMSTGAATAAAGDISYVIRYSE